MSRTVFHDLSPGPGAELLLIKVCLIAEERQSAGRRTAPGWRVWWYRNSRGLFKEVHLFEKASKKGNSNKNVLWEDTHYVLEALQLVKFYIFSEYSSRWSLTHNLLVQLESNCILYQYFYLIEMEFSHVIKPECFMVSKCMDNSKLNIQQMLTSTVRC